MNTYLVVRQFEKELASYAGSKYAVSVDSCTSALLLCCAYVKVEEVTIPCRTYPSVPCSVIHAGGKVCFEDISWSGVYQLKPYPIWDGAKRFHRNMYIQDSFHCLSFHMKKQLPIGTGGAILTDDKEAAEIFADEHGPHWLKVSQICADDEADKP